MPRLEHIGIAVQDLAAVLKLLDDLIGEAPYKVEDIEPDRIRTYFVRGGGVKLELLEATASDSPVRRFVERRGPGLHHLAFEVDDIDAAFERVKRLGYTPLDEAPRNGADGKRIFFLHPKETGGVLLEFCRTARSTLSEPFDVAGAVVRTAGSADRTAFVHLYEDEPRLSPEDLARRMEQRFFVASIETSASAVLAHVLDELNVDTCHVATECDFPSVAAVVDRLRSLVMIGPSGGMPEGPRIPTLAVASDDEAGLRAAALLHSRAPRAAIAVLPSLDLALPLIERHAVENP